MAVRLPSEELIYTALKDVFKGNAALVRKSKKVKELIEKSSSKAIKHLRRDHGTERIFCTTKVLLEQGIFQSTLKAKERFPKIFELIHSQRAAPKSSNAEATRCEVVAVPNVIKEQQAVSPSASVGKSSVKPLSDKRTKKIAGKACYTVP